jgi:hypothetical protein
VFFSCLIALSSTLRSVTAATPAPNATVLPVNPFGAVEAYYRPSEASDLGVSWDRIIFEWRLFQPNSATDWDTSHVPDNDLQDAADAHREVIGLIKNAPHWATGSALFGATSLGIDKPFDDPANLFGTFVTRLVAYYSTRWHIHHWIIYNEPDIRPEENTFFEFSGTEADYYLVLKTAYMAAHTADPDAVIHLAGTTWWQDVIHKRQLWLERLLRIALKDPDAARYGLFFDALSIHVYGDTNLVWKMTLQLASLPASMGYPKPIWIDEMNAHLTSDGNWQLPSSAHPVSLDQQAAFVVQGSALGLTLGAQGIAIYHLYEDADPNQAGSNAGLGLIRNDGTYRPAYYAYRAVVSNFSSTIKAERLSAQGVTDIVLHQADKTVSVLWNETSQPIKIRIPMQNSPRIVSMLGKLLPFDNAVSSGVSNELTLPACIGECLIQGEPRLLISSGTTPPAVYMLDSKGRVMRLN